MRMVGTILCSLALLGAGFGQQQPPTFKTRAELVMVPVTVSEGSELVSGLTQADFTVLHNGKAEKIAVFEEVEASPAQLAPTALPARTVQNFVATKAHDDLAVLLLDFLNGNWNSAARIRSFLPEISRLFADTETPVAVLLLTRDGLVQIHSLTNRPDDFVAAMERAAKFSGSKLTITPWTSIAMPVDTNLAGSAFHTWGEPLGLIDQRKLDKAEMTLRAVEQIARGFAGVSGRKKLIWISNGFPTDISAEEGLANPSSIMLQMQRRAMELRAWHTLSSANIAIYGVDANGVVNPSWHDWHCDKKLMSENTINEVHCNFAPEKPNANLKTDSPDSVVRTNTASLLEAAQMTGGTTCTLAPDKCVDKSLKDSSHYYLVGFYLQGEQKPGWHKLKVQVARPGVSVRARSGFAVDEPEAAQPTAQPQAALRTASVAATPAAQKDVDAATNDPIIVALASPLDYTGVPLRLNWAIKARDAAGVTVDLVLSTPAGAIGIADDKSMSLDCLAYVRTFAKNDGVSYPFTLSRRLSPQQEESLASTGLLYRKQLTLKPGRYDVRVLLRDNVTRQIGTVSTQVDLTQ